MTGTHDLQDETLRARFAVPHTLAVRPAQADPDLALVVEDQRAESFARLWRVGEAPGEELPFPVAVGAIIAGDGNGWIVDLADGGGSEVGSLVATSLDGSRRVDLTPGREPFVLRGLEASADGSLVLASIVDEQGYHLLAIPARPWGPASVVHHTAAEAWYGQPSADGRLASMDTTDHNPGVRRAAVSVFEVASGAPVAVLDDLPAGPVRAVRFSPEPGDERLLVATERTGYVRPAIWDPLTGERVDFEASDLEGEVIPLDWHAADGRILAVHVFDGIQRLLEFDERTGAHRVVRVGGSFANPDVADLHAFQWSSWYRRDGGVVALRSAWDVPLHAELIDQDGTVTVALPPAATPPGVPFTSHMVPSADGVPVQVWLGLPSGRAPLGTVLEVHGGPNLVFLDEYNPSAQAWIDAGFAYATVNYRGSVTFGQAFREGFWGSGGDREIDDIAAAVGWLREQGLGDPASTFITGASFGGHLTLLSLGRLPELFAGGFAHVAVADWEAAIAAMNPAVRGVWQTWVPPEAVARYSAVSYVDRVRGSAWINQGALDTRTPVVGVQRFVDEIAARGGDVVLRIFDGGHEPTGLELLESEQRIMIELAHRTLDGRRWSDGAERPASAAGASSI
ncbi:prolyl oligopeptidase family serine peptidase [Agromyces sp. NPDC060279]|uniref:prolyl oligopeptidase family serine peptidase n=1 Tax=Agromyces sp. NPDC060279 TaxID=3347092 RepID=UPI003648F821